MANYRNLEEALKALASKFERDLAAALRSAGHYKTGKLEGSVKFSFNKTGDKYILSLVCLDYILYLDNGSFIDNFLSLKQKELEEVIVNAIIKDIEINLN